MHFSCALPTKTTPSGLVEVGAELGGNVLLALPFAKIDQGNALSVDELFNGGDELTSDRFHYARGSHRIPAVSTDEPQYPLHDLQPGNIDVEIHPVDPFHFQGDVLVGEFQPRFVVWSSSAPFVGRPLRPTNRFGGLMNGGDITSVLRPQAEPSNTCSSGWGESPVSVL